MTATALTLAAIALGVSAHTAWHTRRAIRRQEAAADYRWRTTGRNDLTARLAARKLAEDEHRLSANGRHHR